VLAVVILEAVAIGLLGLLVAGLLRSHAEILRQLHHLGGGLDLDRSAPVPLVGRRPAVSLVGETADGEAVSLALDRPGEQTLLLFLSSGCGTCGAFWDGLGERAVPGVRTVVVTRDAAEESPSEVQRLAPPGVTVVLSSGAWEVFAVPGSPYAVLVEGTTGRV